MRRPVLTAEQADDLENELSSYVADSGYDAKYAKKALKEYGLPPEVVEGVLARVSSLLDDVATLEAELGCRDNIEIVADAFKSLDKYLNKHIRVVGKRRGSRKDFTFRVG